MGSASQARLFEARRLKVREDPKPALVAQMLQRHGKVQLRAWGTSMLPIVWPGDLLTIEFAAPNQLIPGDILLLLRNGRFFIHRLVERRKIQNSLYWITRGDAMPHNDPPAAASDLLGRVVRIDRGDDRADDRSDDRSNDRANDRNIDRAHRTIVPARRVSQIQLALAWIEFRRERLRNSELRIRVAKHAKQSRLRQSFRTLWSSLHRVRSIPQSGASSR